MAYSHITYAGDGVTRDYIVPFPYMKSEDVRVAINDEDAGDVTWITPGTLQLAEALCPIQQIADDEHFPAVTDQHQRRFHRTGRHLFFHL